MFMFFARSILSGIVATALIGATAIYLNFIPIELPQIKLEVTETTQQFLTFSGIVFFVGAFIGGFATFISGRNTTKKEKNVSKKPTKPNAKAPDLKTPLGGENKSEEVQVLETKQAESK